MEPRAYFELIAKPLIDAFLNDDKSIHKLYAACTNSFHIVDHIAVHQGRKTGDDYLEMVNQFPDFKTL